MLYDKLIDAYTKNRILLRDFISMNKKNMCYPEKLLLKHIFDIVVNPELPEKDRYNTSDIRMLSYTINDITQELYVLHTDIHTISSISGIVQNGTALIEDSTLSLSANNFICTRLAFTEDYEKRLFGTNMDEIPSEKDVEDIIEISLTLLSYCRPMFIPNFAHSMKAIEVLNVGGE